jgi:voltage-gated potassium channel
MLAACHGKRARTVSGDSALMLRRPILIAFAALLALTAIGVLGYVVIVGMSFMDALYMTVITLSTVGYREVQPLGTAGEVFTIGLIFGGFGIVLYSAGLIAREIIEGEFQRTFGRRKVQRQIEQVSDHFIVCGFGRMGRIVCKELMAKPVPFVVVERHADALRDVEAEQFLLVAGDATEDHVLLQAGITRARGLVSALSTDSDNVYVALTARELNPNLLIVARAEDDRSERRLLHAGATRVVSPYVIGGHRMAHALLRPAVLDVIDLATHYRSIELQIEEVQIPKGGVGTGTTLQDSGIRETLGIIVIAIKKPNGEMLFNPGSDARIVEGDRLVVIGQTANLREFERRLQAG